MDVTPNPTTAYAENAKYTFKFTLTTNLPQNSEIQVTLPTAIKIKNTAVAQANC